MQNQTRSIPLNQISVPILAVAGMTAFCYFAAGILVPLVTAITLAYVLWPMVARLKKWKVPHIVAVLLVLLLAIIVLALIGLLIYGQAVDFAESVPGYWEQFEKLRSEKLTNLPPMLNDLIDTKAEEVLGKIDLQSLSTIPKFIFKGVGSVFSFLGQAVLVFLLTLFVLIEQPAYSRRMKMLFGQDQSEATGSILGQVSERIAGYMWQRFVITVALAIIFTVGLLIGGVKYAYIWGPLAAILNLVPYVGAYVGAVPPMLMALVQYNSATAVVLVFAFFMAVQFVESNIVTPRMLQGSLNISLLAQLISTLYWGWLWGAIGIILAVPITAAFKVLCDNIDSLKPLGIMLSGDDR